MEDERRATFKNVRMKKLLLVLTPLLLFFCLIPEQSAAQINSGGDGGGNLPGIGNIGMGPWFPDKRPGGSKSGGAYEPVEAWFDSDFGRITVEFDDDLGTVNVAIVDCMGRVFASATCDTAVQYEVWLPIPETPGHYVLHVRNAEGGTYGEFEV